MNKFLTKADIDMLYSFDEHPVEKRNIKKKKIIKRRKKKNGIRNNTFSSSK